MTCKCKNCNKELKGEDFKNRVRFQVASKKATIIVCSEECKREYLNKEEQKAKELKEWRRVYGSILRVMGYRKGQVVPKSILTNIQDLRNGTNRFIKGGADVNKKQGYSYEVIYQTIQQSEDAILKALTYKEFKTESSKIAYVMAIIRNNLAQVQDNVEKDNKVKFIQELQSQSRETGENFDFMDSPKEVEIKKTKVDLSRFF